MLVNFKATLIQSFPSFYQSFSENNDITYANLGHPNTSQKEIKDLFRNRVVTYFNEISERIDKFSGGLEALKQQETLVFNEPRVKFVRTVNGHVYAHLNEFDISRKKVVDRIIVFRELIKSYSRAKGLSYSKDNSSSTNN